MEYSYVEVQFVIHLTTDPGIQILHPNLLLQLTKNEIDEHFVKRSVIYMFLIKQWTENGYLDESKTVIMSK